MNVTLKHRGLSGLTVFKSVIASCCVDIGNTSLAGGGCAAAAEDHQATESNTHKGLGVGHGVDHFVDHVVFTSYWVTVLRISFSSAHSMSPVSLLTKLRLKL